MKKVDFKNIHTMIGNDAVVEGGITLQGGLIVYGKVLGNLATDGPVRIAKGGAVYGQISASDAHIGGLVEGDVTVQNRAILGSAGVLTGNLVYRTLIIEEGARFEGKCVLAGSTEPEPAPPG